MTLIKKLITDVKKKCDYNIFDSIIIEELNNDNSKILISNFYQECIDSKFGNINKVMKYINNCNKCIKIYSNISNISINLYYKKNNKNYCFLNQNRTSWGWGNRLPGAGGTRPGFP